MGEGAQTFRVSDTAYDRYMGRYSDPLAQELLRAAGVEPGQRALDVGCGPGALTAALVSALGADSVAAVDPSEPFVEACRRRNPGVDVRVGAAEGLPFPDGGFDLVLAQLVVQFMSDAPSGVRELRRVARPGGVVAACTWDYGEGMTMLRTFWGAAQALDPAAPDEAATLRYCRRGELGALWRETGLRDVEDGALTVEAGYAGFDDFWEPFTLGVGPGGAYCASLDAERRAALREECCSRLGEPAGPFTLGARAWYAVGRT